MQQAALFHDSLLVALGADIAAAGGMKRVAGLLWPTLGVSSAEARLRSGLNPDHAQKLCPLEVLRVKELSREAGSFATVQYESQRLGIEWKALAPAEAKKRVKRARVTALLSELARLTGEDGE